MFGFYSHEDILPHLPCMFVCSDAGDSLNDCRIMFLTEIYKIEEPGSPGDVPAGAESPLKSRFRNGRDCRCEVKSTGLSVFSVC